MFEFIKYVHPSNYYCLVLKMPQAILLCEENLNHRIGYRSEISEKLDKAYYNLQSGVIPKKEDLRQQIQNLNVNDVIDNYIFLRRYFSPVQVMMVFLMRLGSLKNPIYELFCLLITRKHKRVIINPQNDKKYEIFESDLLNKSPFISVIIPTLNRYQYLKDVLEDLEKQDYKNFEVLVCDQSEPIREAFYEDWNLNIKLIVQEEKALWLARNRCVKMANGEYILLFDDDSRVETNWVSSHLKCLDYFNVSISAGVTNTIVGHGLSPKESYFHLSDVFDTGNALVERKVFEKVGLFDRQFEKQRMGDGEFGLRSLLGGFQIVSNPNATRVHLKVETGGLRQMGSWDALRPKKLLAPRPVPSVLYLIRKYFGNSNAIFYLFQNIPFSFIPYKFKKSKILKILFLLFLPLLLPLMLLVSLKSWMEANRKLREGPKIDFLK
jgi:glycosyltransferase involved in cell wall biosynthesis